MNKVPFRKRFRYWIDHRMSKGTASMVKLLLWAVLSMVLLVTVVVLLCNLQKEGKSVLAVFWDNLRSAMSSSFPSSDSGGLLYIILYTLLGLTGMIFTGMLIGIFSTSMRAKLLALQKDNPEIIETGHTVILGFRNGEFALLSQMIQAAGSEKRTIVVVENMERQDMESAIRANIKIPRNVRLIVIKADTGSASSLSCCAIPACETLVVHTRDKGRTVKTLLAVEILLNGTGNRPHIVATVDSDTSIFPDDLLKSKQISMLHSGDVVARIAAHAATQPGIFDAFMDMIDFDNFEFYFEGLSELHGLPFWKAVLSAENGIVTGIFRDGEVMLNPEPETVILKEDLLVVFEEEPGDVKFPDLDTVTLPETKPVVVPEPIREVVIFGISRAVTTVIDEFPDNVERVRLIGLTSSDMAFYLPEDKTFASELVPDYRNTESDLVLTGMVRNASHLVLLADRRKSEEDADTETMLRIIRLRNIKKKYDLKFTITAEIRCENNRKLIIQGSTEDFVVASDLSSMMLAQVAEDPRRLSLFNDLLDENGSEVYLRPAAEFGLTGQETTLTALRSELYAYGYILMGLRTKETFFHVMDDESPVTLSDDDRLILIGEA